jgi:hypothetical protein
MFMVYMYPIAGLEVSGILTQPFREMTILGMVLIGNRMFSG